MADTYDEFGNLVNASPLGFASAPGTPVMTPPDPGMAAARDQSEAGTSFQQQAVPGLGIATGAAQPLQSTQQRTKADQDYLESLSPTEKIGLALQAFSAGFSGRENPIETLLKRKRENDQAARRELVESSAILTHAFEESRKYDAQSIQGKAVRNAYKRLLPPEMHAALDAVGTDKEDEAKSLSGLVSDPDVQGALVKVCGRDKACWVKQVNDADWLKQMYQTVDTKRLMTALPKLRAFKEQVVDKGGLQAKQDSDGKYTLSWPELMEGNAKMKLFTDAEMDTFRRNPDYLIPYGIRTTKALAAADEAKAKAEVKGTEEWGEPYKLNGALVQKNKNTGQIRTAVTRQPEGARGELTAGQKAKLKRDAEAYDNALKFLQKYKIGDDGSSSDPKINARMQPDKRFGVVQDPQLAGRVRDALKRRDAGDPRVATEEKPPAEKPKPAAVAAPKGLSQADRQKVLDAATAAVNKGADPEAVKKRLKEKYGIEVTFAPKKK